MPHPRRWFLPVCHYAPGMAALSPTEFNSAVTAITTAFGDPTRRENYLFAPQASDGVTAPALAEPLEPPPNVARLPLDTPAAVGYL